MHAALGAEIGRSLCPTAPQTIACSAFYEAEFLLTHNISNLNRIQPDTAALNNFTERRSMDRGVGQIRASKWAKSS
jgi:hypothetical protein